MGALANLVPNAQPAVADGGATGYATAGGSWNWPITGVTDNAGNPIDLSGCTGVCKIIDLNDAPIATLTVTGASNGSFTLTLDETVTAAIAAGTYLEPATYRWYATFTDGTDVVYLWHPVNSYFYVYKGH